MTAPQWAQDLVLQVALDEGRDNCPNVTWRKRRRRTWKGWYDPQTPPRGGVPTGRTRTWTGHDEVVEYAEKIPAPKYSSGHTKLGKRNAIHVTAGRDKTDLKLVVLHEMAHWLTQARHTPEFWDTAWRLYRTYKVPLTYAKEREGNYRKGALVAARKRS